ncbi:MAG: hydantoinase/oxoprolinase family protein [Pseudomonadota bacterium]
MAYRLAVDVGGTFTDFGLQDEASGEVSIFKELTTPQDPSVGVMRGATHLLRMNGIQFKDIVQVIHGTTLVTNTVIERKGARTGLITTRGFRDVLHLGRQKRHDLYDLFIEKPPSLVPRYLIKEISARRAYDGSIITKADAAEIRAVVRELIGLGAESIAVCLLHSYANADDEKLVETIISEEVPQIPVSLSSGVSPVYREYERTQTTVMNAYVAVRARDYLNQLVSRLRSKGFKGNLYVMQSAGGIATAEAMERYPVRMIESGPAAGALIAAFYGRLCGYENLISFDMGGTTAKMCLIEKGKPDTTNEFEVDRVKLIPGSGLTINVPAIDLIEIGAGGGSIAQLAHGLIQVGPESAGADPGPICYGYGGTEPTVTDADLVLGYLNPDYFLGGEMKLDRDAAVKGIEDKIAKPLGVGIAEAAWGIHEIVTANMERATRVVSIERGRDPRLLTFIAFGGAGPIHGTRLARNLGITRIIIPGGAGVTSAFGLLCADIRFDLARTYVNRLDGSGFDAINQMYQEMEDQGRQMLIESEVRGEPILARTADMHYVGQGHEVTVPLPTKPLSEEDLPALDKTFNEVYAARYGYSDPGEPIEAVTWKLAVYTAGKALILKRIEKTTKRVEEALKGHRPAYFPEHNGYIDCPVYDRYRLFPEARVTGPAVIEERECTVVLLPGQEAVEDTYGNLIITEKTGGESL